ncbi:beta family protein [Asticcacaulis taihuensis]|uniref:Beta protein n=1 Tax=Asticcacaulis taihuensis TaxID=260084 RepID=A0A1G4TGU7_9CAUL|nr:beta family protein [Asticcacaulis taihuensis]SCW80055.1 Beta protein [Asticcacaulis taihuensis]
MNLHGQQLLDSIKYLPCLRSRQAEVKGYMQLSPIAKASLHPLISIGKFGRLTQTSKVLEAIQAKIGGCFVDLNMVSDQSCDDLAEVTNPENHYLNWRELVRGYPGLTPAAIIDSDGSERAFIRQVVEIEAEYNTVLIRTKKPSIDLGFLKAALAAVADVNSVFIVLDFGYIRGALETKIVEARRVITALRETEPSARIAVVSSSFPKSVAAYGDGQASLEIIDREFHTQLGGDEVAIYGDHSAIYPEPFEPMISRWVPRIDYCTEYSWFYARRRDDDGGYVECARRIVSLEDWDVEFARANWGADIILQTANTGVVPSGFGAPANWIAARVNMHIERQLSVSFPDEADAVDPYDLDDLM